jgi:hypothetical protein
MVVRNDLDRFHLASDVIDRVPKLDYMAAYAKQAMRDKLIEHKQYITATATTCPRSRTGAGPAPTPEAVGSRLHGASIEAIGLHTRKTAWSSGSGAIAKPSVRHISNIGPFSRNTSPTNSPIPHCRAISISRVINR